MTPSTPELRDLAFRLLSEETKEGKVAPFATAAKFCGQLSTVLSKLTGTAGSHSLLARALALAQQEAPCLANVQLTPNGQLHGFVENMSNHEQDEWNKAGLVLVGQLLGLLNAFIGQRLTMQLVNDAWPISPERTAAVRNEPIP